MRESKEKRAARIDAENRELCAYREAFFCLRAGKVPMVITTGEDETLRSVELLGPERASGGVIIHHSSMVEYATEWLTRVAYRGEADPYITDLARKVQKAIDAAVQKNDR